MSIIRSFRSSLPVLRVGRFNSTTAKQNDFRSKLMDQVKQAMKAKNTIASTTFRSALAEINNADKAGKEPLNEAGMVAVVRKGIQRRTDAAAKFSEANRQDLAQKELNEVQLLESLVPPLLTAKQLDVHLKAVLDALPAGTDLRRSTGLIFKELYSRVNAATVTGELVKQRLKALTEEVI
ncbi:GatB YqeY domain-containing protein [Crepidotus variabilis]|uniref:Altered inheritance of mitochondria protein 41 n=1 Tax=Crepidotus variabilis TaxID=179855 RepID=A0A9P6EHQ9_9AGAR|nr:GatB YqeY domain-containing protein [Crepidotus variabilis]